MSRLILLIESITTIFRTLRHIICAHRLKFMFDPWAILAKTSLISILPHVSLLSRCQPRFRSPFLYFGASIGVNLCNRCMRIRCAHAPIHTARKGLQGHSERTPPNGKAPKEAKSYSSRHYLLAIYGLNYSQPITS